VPLRLLLDQHLSPDLLPALARLCPELSVVVLQTWHGGMYYGQADETLLEAAAEESLTLLTGDVSTIPELLIQWAAIGRSHAGVIFIPRGFPQGNVGETARAFTALYRAQGANDWKNIVLFLQRA
jgi:hypothetical protein